MLLLDQDHIKFNSENKERFYADLAINYGISALEFFNKNQAIDLNEPDIFEMLQSSTFINSILAQALVILYSRLMRMRNLLDFN